MAVLSPSQRHLLEEMVSIPSWSQMPEELSRGEILRIIREIRGAHASGSTEAVMQTADRIEQIVREGGLRGPGELEILERIEAYFPQPDFRTTRWEVEGDRKWVFLAEKGDEDAEFTVMLYAHVDTVGPAPGWNGNPFELRRDKTETDKLYGLGAYDMKAGVMAIIDTVRNIDVPRGVKIVVALAPDEEGNSAGADRLREWPGMEKVDLVLSPEIITIGRQESDHPKDIIVNRLGNVKTIATIDVPQAHGFQPNAPRSTAEMDAFKRELVEKFPLFARQHPFFGPVDEFFDEVESKTKRGSGLSVPTNTSSEFIQFIVPPHTPDEAIAWQQLCMKSVGDARTWSSNKVRATLSRNTARRAYEPYIVDMETDLAKAILDSVDEVYGGHNLKGGLSTSDGNVFVPHAAKNGKKLPWLEVGPVGGGAHSTEEWVSEESIVKLTEWMRVAITKHIPKYLASRSAA